MLDPQTIMVGDHDTPLELIPKTRGADARSLGEDRPDLELWGRPLNWYIWCRIAIPWFTPQTPPLLQYCPCAILLPFKSTYMSLKEIEHLGWEEKHQTNRICIVMDTPYQLKILSLKSLYLPNLDTDFVVSLVVEIGTDQQVRPVPSGCPVLASRRISSAYLMQWSFPSHCIWWVVFLRRVMTLPKLGHRPVRFRLPFLLPPWDLETAWTSRFSHCSIHWA